MDITWLTLAGLLNQCGLPFAEAAAGRLAGRTGGVEDCGDFAADDLAARLRDRRDPFLPGEVVRGLGNDALAYAGGDVDLASEVVATGVGNGLARAREARDILQGRLSRGRGRVLVVVIEGEETDCDLFVVFLDALAGIVIGCLRTCASKPDIIDWLNDYPASRDGVGDPQAPFGDDRFSPELGAFVRGFMPSAAFEQWVYGSAELESQLERAIYLQVIEADYRSSEEVFRIRRLLEMHINACCDPSGFAVPVAFRDIHAILLRAREIDPHCQHFGAEVHRYRLGPVLTEVDIALWEAALRVVLPRDFRWFLRHIGNGGAGPFYGIRPLSVTALPLDGSDFKSGLSQPFPYIESVKDLRGPFPPGILEICHQGCDGYSYLVLSGPSRGQIWWGWCGRNFGREAPGFAEWYREGITHRWLSRE